jgi:caffeoyl-CoA O-methyltransferase
MPSIVEPRHLDYLDSLKAAPDALIREMENYAAERGVPILDRRAAELLETLVRAARPARLLEIGTAIGYSAVRMARAAEKDAVVETIELSEEMIAQAERNFERSGADERIRLHKGDAREILPALEGAFDLIFLDADKEDYEAYFDVAVEKLREGGTLVVDNLLWHGYAAPGAEIPERYRESTEHIRRFNRAFLDSPALDATILTVADGVGVGVKRTS